MLKYTEQCMCFSLVFRRIPISIFHQWKVENCNKGNSKVFAFFEWKIFIFTISFKMRNFEASKRFRVLPESLALHNVCGNLFFCWIFVFRCQLRKMFESPLGLPPSWCYAEIALPHTSSLVKNFFCIRWDRVFPNRAIV